MDIDKAPLLEELVDGVGDEAAHPEHGLKGVGAGTQMGHGAQEFQGVALFLQGIVGGGGALHGDLGCLELEGLLGVGGLHQGALDDESGAHIELGDGLEVLHGVVVDHLEGVKIRAVGEDNKAEGLAGADAAHPAAHGDFLAGVVGGVPEQVPDSDEIHGICTPYDGRLNFGVGVG